MQKENIQIDEIIKTILMTDNTELVKFVNTNLKTNHNPKKAKVLRLASEFTFKNIHESTKKKYTKRIADAIFSIDGYLYNIEFQTTHDGKMLVRILEYQFGAMFNKIKDINFDDEYSAEITLPHSIMIQLEKSKNVADYYKLTYINSTTNERLSQQFPIVKMWEYEIEDLRKNGLYMLLPFKNLVHRKNDIDIDNFIKDTLRIRKQIFDLYSNGDISEKFYTELYEAHQNISTKIAHDYINEKHPKKSEVDNMFVVVEERPSLVKKYVDREVAKALEAAKEAAEAAAKEAAKAAAKEATKEAEAAAKEAAKKAAKEAAKEATEAKIKGKKIGIAEKALKAFELGWKEQDIIEFFGISSTQAKEILDFNS